MSQRRGRSIVGVVALLLAGCDGLTRRRGTSDAPLLSSRGRAPPPPSSVVGRTLASSSEGGEKAPASAALARACRLRGGSGLSFAGASPFVLKCAGFAALDALLLGYDIGVVSGILFFIKERFGLDTHAMEVFASAINSAAIVGALTSGLVADRFGRKPALFISSLMFTTGSFVMALAGSYSRLLQGRYIQGFGIGAGLIISPLFISEIAPPQFRGSLVTLSEVSLSLGILLAYLGNFALSGVANQWRWMLALGAFPGVLLTLRILFLPESPRYLISKGHRDEARRVLDRITRDGKKSAREVAAEADEVLRDITRRAAAEDGGSWSQLRKPSVLIAVGVGCILAILQHAVGIESIIYYSPHIFQKAGIASQRGAILGTVGMGLIKLIFETCDRRAAAPPAPSAPSAPSAPPALRRHPRISRHRVALPSPHDLA